MNHVRVLCAALIGLTGLQMPALAADLGDPAPPLKVYKWVKGGPVDLADGRGKNVYLLDFWATWCAPCLAASPHATELQKKYKDKGLIVVGITHEVSPKHDHRTVKKVEKCVEKMGEKMGYAVAIDEGGGTFDAYMTAFGLQAIPRVFIIDRQGRVVWHDHPLEVDKALEQVIAGTFDLDAARKVMRQRQEAAERLAEARKLDKKYFTMLQSGGSPEMIRAVGDEFLKSAQGNAAFLDRFAWKLLSMQGAEGQDVELALRVAEAASAASEGKDASILNTYARALFANGQTAEAIKRQKRAIELSDDPAMTTEFKKALASYEGK
ncbi:MAG: TlpA family protein disulfide reductase [Planctomycetes bacterium]|nr:TlpA family protein disulfide reductase [Planctomycetota bacterium]